MSIVFYKLFLIYMLKDSLSTSDSVYLVSTLKIDGIILLLCQW